MEEILGGGEGRNRPGRQRNQQKQFEQQGQGRKLSICPEPSAEKLGGEEADEVDTTTTTNMSQASTIISENTTHPNNH